MRKHRSLAIVAALLMSLPLLGDTCTEDKVVEIVLGFPATATFLAEGILNVHDETAIVTKDDFDVAGAIAEANIDVNEIDVNGIAISRVFYKCKVADPRPDRQIVNGELSVVRLDDQGAPIGAPVVFVTGWTGDFGAVTDFIDITDTIGGPGIDYLNQIVRDCVESLQVPVGTPEAPFAFQYSVSGNSIPADIRTNFQWELLVQFQSIIPQTFQIPF